MPRLSKTVLANTFRLDCDRYLRFRLASQAERSALNLSAYDLNRPGPHLMSTAGSRWEASKYQDLIDETPAGSVAFRRENTVDPELGVAKFEHVDNLFDILRDPTPPTAILEGEYEVPANFLPGLDALLQKYGIDRARCRPDVLWIQAAPTGVELLCDDPSGIRHEIHIVDVKMAAEPSLKHFTEVTFYALALAQALEAEGLSDRYAVSAQGYIWPGTHEINDFRTRIRRLRAEGAADPVAAALGETLVAVPHEVYHVHVRQFFEERLPRVLAQAPTEASWHLTSKCHLCDYVGLCREEAKATDHLCRIPWLNQGQADLLRREHIGATRELREAIETCSPSWQRAARLSQQLRADAPALVARARALHSNALQIVDNRVCATMPAWWNAAVFLTVHFDPGSGISFVMGASRVFWPDAAGPGTKPIRENRIFVVDRAENLNPATERKRLVEFVQTVHDWLMEVDAINKGIPKDFDRHKVHVFVWDHLEVRQIKRMLERHMGDEAVVDAVDLLVRLFPPESMMAEAEMVKSQPYTVVKDVFRQLVGLPLPHDYTLFDTVDAFYPDPKAAGGYWTVQRHHGFHLPGSDQIPFERGYELWMDQINLRHKAPTGADPKSGRPFSRDEIYDGIREAARLRLRSLEMVVDKLRKNHKDRLVLKKTGFLAAKPPKMSVPMPARRLMAFEKLNAVAGELDNRFQRALPLEEREARYVCIRGLRMATGPAYDAAIAEARAANPTLTAPLYAFTFAPSSRDARVKEGDFLLALSNEDARLDLDAQWRRHAELDFEQARDRLCAQSLGDTAMVNAKLGRLLGVTVHRLETAANPPYLVLSPNNPDLFTFACLSINGEPPILDMDRPMVLDPLYADFHTGEMEKALRGVGGRAGSLDDAPASNGKKKP